MKKIMVETYAFRKLGRMFDFAIAHRDRFEPGTAAATAVAELISRVGNLKVLSADQASLENRLIELLRAKREARIRLREEVLHLYHTAHEAAAEIPGFDDRFGLPLKGTPKLLQAARAALQDAAPNAEIFVRHAMPPDFLEILAAKTAALESALEEVTDTRAAIAAGSKVMWRSLRQSVAASHRVNAIMRNTLRNDRITLEAWKNACRVTRPSPKEEAAAAAPKPPEPEPSPPATATTGVTAAAAAPEPPVQPEPLAAPTA